MKIPAFYIPISLLILDLVLSLPQVPLHIIGALRIAFIPLLFIVLLDASGKISIQRLKFAIYMSGPLLVLPMLFAFQVLALPSDALSIHLSGCTKFVCWILGYLCTLLTLNNQSARKTRSIILYTFIFIFLATIVQYPFIIAKSSTSIAVILKNFGRGEKNFFGLFAAANEDANSTVTLLPFLLMQVEKLGGLKKFVLLACILFYFSIVLLFNGTRTALLITFPLILFIFYSKLSIKAFLGISPLIGLAFLLYNAYGRGFTEEAFSKESGDSGTFSFRLERVWIPASTYTFEHSPLVGFGSRGWEYVGSLVRLVRSASETNAFEIIPSHNVYVWTFVSWGILGSFIYVTFLILLLKESFGLSKNSDAEVAMFGRTLFCSMIAYCFWAFISNANIEAGWVILILLGVMISSLKITVFWNKRNQYQLANS